MYNYCIMESFYLIVISIALLALIGILTYVGILMTYYRDKDTTYPPVAGTCPDFWIVSDEHPTHCKLPTVPTDNSIGIKNVGSIYSGSALELNASNTPGLNQQTKAIDFADAKWGMAGSAVCKKQAWANQYGLVWDGVTNYNSC